MYEMPPHHVCGLLTRVAFLWRKNMSTGRMSFNLQDEKQMEQFRKLLGGEYEYRRTKTNGRKMAADKKHTSGSPDMREISGDAE